VKPYYQDEAVTIYHGDCREVLPSEQVKGVGVSDPPYGVGIKYSSAYDDSRDKYWDWFLPCLETLRKYCVPLIFTHRNHAMKYITGWDWIGVWSKPGSFGARIGNSCVLPHWEPIFMFGIHGIGTKSDYRSDVYTFNPNNNGASVRGIGREKWTAENFSYHPCPKPLGLYASFIQTFAQNNEVIIDPFMGSGTTLRAAKDLGRRAIGIEIEERYCEIAAKRCETIQEELFDVPKVKESQVAVFQETQ
jgi:site-specific DNA-methyltransferase (adenine-specific)